MSNKNITTQKNSKILSLIEKLGNKFPHPATMFLYLIGFIFVTSFILNKLGVSTINPSTGDTIAVKNLLSINGLLLLMTNFVSNFQNFPVLGIVLILGIATGVCDKSGLFTSSIKMGLTNVTGNSVVFIIATIGIIANNAGDIAIIILPLLAAAIFKGLGRHPIAGAFLGYAVSGGAFGTSIIPGVLDAIFAPITIAAAKTVDPSFDMPLLSSYFILLASGILAVITSSLVTIKIIEPMLGKYEDDGESEDMQISLDEKKAVKKSGFAVLLFLTLIVIVAIPSNSFLRGEGGSLMVKAPLMNSLSFFVIVIFFLAGFVYAFSTKQVTNMTQAFNMMTEAVKPLASFIVLGTIIAQFLFFFGESNLGQIIAVEGGKFLSNLPVPPQIIVVLFFLFITLVNIFMGGGLPKYLLLSPIIIPILMQLNIHPAFAQVIYRLGDSATNNLTPLTAYFAIMLTTVQKYKKDAGLGTIFSGMIPYTVAYIVVYSLVLVIWMTLGIPTGVGGGVWLN